MFTVERNHALSVLAHHFQRRIAAMAQQLGAGFTQAQYLGDHCLFDTPVAPVEQQFADVRWCLQCTLPRSEVHRAPVVGVDQAEVPELIALVNIRHTRHGQMKQGLRQPIQGAGGGDGLRSTVQRTA
ncbi:hypothetical protein PFLmoz3_02564 [Pseudomonas fluorescens]|uniref:Uncharacterized protein n=1 Tax=Pseudomonas fluorescens TaxID=294 RepID=A0A109LIB7_PSEFL|nr:hypothetical protein PFLmoz3_02564 [Pseudomonas fluorescens]